MRQMDCEAIASHLVFTRVSLVPEPDEADYLRLSRQVATVLSALPLQVDGRDCDAEDWAAFQGLRRSDVVIVPVRFRSQSLILVVSRSQVWRESKNALVELKRLGRHGKRRILLVPSGWLRRTTFLVNCAMIGLSRSTKVTATIRMAVVDQLQSDPLSSLRDCVSQITNHDDPAGAVLAMVGEGLLRLDLRQPIRPDSRISFA